MDPDRKNSIGLMRYGAIAPVINGLGEEYPSLSAYFREVSEKGITAPDGSARHYAASTIERWYSDYRRKGFDALLPLSRSDAGVPRKLDDELVETIRNIKTACPRIPASAILQKLIADGRIKEGEVSESTILRCVNTIVRTDRLQVGKDMRRYERPHINEVWYGDSSAGPYLRTEDGKKHKVFIIAFIDDASRFIPGIDMFFEDNFINVMSVMKSAVSKYGCPRLWCFDNGSNYRSGQMELLAARIGSVIHYCHPYSPTEKAKIERWFRTLKDHWMATLDMRDFRSLEELRGSLLAYVRTYNQTVHSSLNGMSPQDRFFSEPEYIRRLSQESIDRSFLLEIERRVSPDCVVTIDCVEYEVDCRYAKQRIRMRYSPDMSEIYVVENDGADLVPVHLLNRQDNSSAKRQKVRLCREDD